MKKVLFLLLCASFAVFQLHGMEREDEKVTLVSSDGQEFETDITIANQSETINNVIEYSGTEKPIPIPNVDSPTLEKILALISLSENNTMEVIKKSLSKLKVYSNNKDETNLIDITNALHFLNFEIIFKMALNECRKRLFHISTFYKIKTKQQYEVFQKDVLQHFKKMPYAIRALIIADNIEYKIFKQNTTLKTESPITSVAFSPDGTQILITSQDKATKLWSIKNPRNPELIQSFTHKFIQSAAFSPDGKHIHIGTKKTILLLNIKKPDKPKLIQRFTSSGFIESIAFSPDGKHFLVGAGERNKYGIATLSDTQKPGKIVVATFNHNNLVSSVAFSPDGKKIITGSWDTTAELWNIEKPHQPRMIFTFKTYAKISLVAFSPDGKHIVIVSQDKTAQLWNIENLNKAIATFKENHNIFSVAFSPDGKEIVFGTGGAAKLWNIQQPNQPKISSILLTHYTADYNTIDSIAFSPNGKRLLIGSTDGSASLWEEAYLDNNIASAQIILYAQQRKMSLQELPNHLKSILNTELELNLETQNLMRRAWNWISGKNNN